jgi:RES domain-containing protein
LTPEDLVLDSAKLFTGQPLMLYRLARAKYANLSGAGAANVPGRWNRPGQEAIYTSTEMGVPLLERLVHTPKDLIPSNLAMMTISLAGGAWRIEPRGIMQMARNELTGADIWLFPAIAAAKRLFGEPSFIALPRVIAIAVPSVIVPVWNFVLYPRNQLFWHHVTLQNIEPFHFDPRLFPDHTPQEALS